GVPAGDVNGLPFLDAGAHLDADTTGVSVNGGSVLVGTTHAAFGASSYPDSARMHVVAPHADLSDFNNFFDTGDTLDGSGSLKFAIANERGRISTSGNVDVAGFRYRNLPIGDMRAAWSSARNTIDGSVAVGGGQGALRAHGSLSIVPRADIYSTVRDSHYDLAATMTDLNLGLWVPALGFTGVPVTGRVSGDGTLVGTYPALTMRGTATLHDGTLGPLAIDSASVTAHSVRKRVQIDDGEVQAAGLRATARGSFGIQASQPIDLEVHANTDDLAGLVYHVARVTVPIKGAFESTLHVGGTYKAPTFVAGVDASNVTVYGLSIASLFGEVRLAGNKLEIANAGATFAKGEGTLAGTVPLELSPLRIGPRDEPVNFDFDVAGVEPSIFDDLLGSHSNLHGTIDGHVGMSGSVGKPVVFGHASLANGSYVSDLEKTPITNATVNLTFNRTTLTVTKASAKLGTGTFDGSGRVEFPNGFDSPQGYSFVTKGVAKAAQFDLPAYGSGTIDADLALDKAAGANALLSGNAQLTNSTLSFAAFINAAQGSASPVVATLPPVGFALNLTAGKNVRVRGNGYGAGLDIGAAGTVHLAGTLASPTLDGAFRSTGGTLTYFDRAFRVQEGAVQFNPSDGLIPTIHAVGSTNVVNPDPDRARNPYGSAQIAITVDGQLENLKIGFTTVPSGYSREQVIAMLAPFGGFVSGIGFNSAAALAPPSPGGITPYGAVAPIPGIYDLQRNGTITVGQEAFNILNAQFTAGLLGPVETAIGQGLGLSSVNLTLGYYGNVGVTATRVLGKAVNAVYATTFGLPSVQSFGIQIQPNENTSATLSFFYQTGPVKVLETTPASSVAVGNNQEVLLGQPIYGTSGFSFKLQRYL
ncbi:MAG: translocation/assembly module TamB domain-containing protein, partial [Candidatus Eremiobacteraeota bacterium]|nr:translocation/assembly module TamB domain-containing protein [Candidatus Eremiobacteraeota bacterium]